MVSIRTEVKRAGAGIEPPADGRTAHLRGPRRGCRHGRTAGNYLRWGHDVCAAPAFPLASHHARNPGGLGGDAPPRPGASNRSARASLVPRPHRGAGLRRQRDPGVDVAFRRRSDAQEAVPEASARQTRAHGGRRRPTRDRDRWSGDRRPGTGIDGARHRHRRHGVAPVGPAYGDEGRIPRAGRSHPALPRDGRGLPHPRRDVRHAPRRRRDQRFTRLALAQGRSPPPRRPRPRPCHVHAARLRRSDDPGDARHLRPDDRPRPHVPESRGMVETGASPARRRRVRRRAPRGRRVRPPRGGGRPRLDGGERPHPRPRRTVVAGIDAFRRRRLVRGGGNDVDPRRGGDVGRPAPDGPR